MKTSTGMLMKMAKPSVVPATKSWKKAYDGTLNKVNDREVVDGTVIAMNKREVVVNIGYKSDGIIPLNEFRYNPDLKIGDTVEVYIETRKTKKDSWFCLTVKLALLALGIA